MLQAAELSVELRSVIRRLKCISLDSDGVLTEGKISYVEPHLELQSFSAHDGHGIKSAQELGLEIAIVSGRVSPVVAVRAEELNIKTVFQGVEDKASVLDELCSSVGCEPSQIAHIGDDVPDMRLFDLVGVSVAPANAHASVLAHVDLVTEKNGGQGAVREFCDLVLEIQSQRTP